MAIESGWAVLIPSFFAGMEAAVIILLRSFGSPDTTDGTSRMSGCPSPIILTAVQLRKAELTSIWNMTRSKRLFLVLGVYADRYGAVVHKGDLHVRSKLTGAHWLSDRLGQRSAERLV